MTTLDKNSLKIQDGLSKQITRLENKLARLAPRAVVRFNQLREERNALVIELHEYKSRCRAFDAAFIAACDDITGQDLDSFQWGE